VLTVKPKVKSRPVENARGDCDAQAVRYERVAAATTGPARLGPGLPAPSALRTRRAQQHHHRHHRPSVGFVRRQADFRFHSLGPLAGGVRQEGPAHTSNQMGDRRKIDRDLVCEAVVLAFHSHAGLTIGARHAPCQDTQNACIVRGDMADERECPMCGGTMRLKRAESTVQIPGNPRPIKRTSTEWVCPECEYFEEADEERS